MNVNTTDQSRYQSSGVMGGALPLQRVLTL
jgi:hypothetical protein